MASLDNSSHTEALNPEVLGEVISKALLKDLKPLLMDIHTITKNVNITSKKINKNSEDISHFLKEELKNDIIIPLKNSVDSTNISMQEIKVVLKETSAVMNETSKGIGKISENLTKLEKSQTDFVANLDGVLDKQREAFEKTTETISNTYENLGTKVKEQTTTFEENSKIILGSFTDLSGNMQTFLDGYKEDYKKMLDDTGKKSSDLITKASETLQDNLTKVNDTLIKTGKKASGIITLAGTEASSLITSASSTLQSTLSGVDEALVKTSDKIQDELKNFRETYTDTLTIFLETQGKQLEEVFGKNTEALTQIVIDFKEVLEDDTINRTTLNDKLNELIEKTNGFVAGTQTMITTAFDVQKVQLVDFMKNNISMQGKLKNMIDDIEIINDNGNTLTEKLIDTTAQLQKQFNDKQTEVLKKYQLEVDTHLEKTMGGISEIASGMLEVVELIHQTQEDSKR